MVLSCQNLLLISFIVRVSCGDILTFIFIWCQDLWAKVESMWELTWPELPFGPFWATLGPFSSPFFPPSRLFYDLCVFWQAIRVERSHQAPAFLRGEVCPPPPDQRVLDQRTPTLGGSSVLWIPWNAKGTVETSGRTWKKEKKKNYRLRYLGPKITLLLWIYTARRKTCIYINL